MNELFLKIFPILTLLLGFLLGCLKDLLLSRSHRKNLQLMLFHELKRNIVHLESHLNADGFFQRTDKSITVECFYAIVANVIPFMRRNVFDQYLGTIHTLTPSIVESLLAVYEIHEHLLKEANGSLIMLWHTAAYKALSSMSIAQKYKDEIQKGVSELSRTASKVLSNLTNDGSEPVT